MQATFLMEQHLGHWTFCQNLRRVVDGAAAASGGETFRAAWVDVTYFEPDGFYERLAFLPATLRGALRGRAQVRSGLRSTAADVLFFNTQAPAVLGGGLTFRRPYVVSTDITPVQYDRMAEPYHHQRDRWGPLRAYKHQVNRRVLREAAAVLPWSTWTRESLVADYDVPVSRIQVVPPGIDLGLWRPAPEAPAGERPFRILFVGGDMDRKGGAILMQAYEALRDAIPAHTGRLGACELHVVTRTPAPSGEGVVAHHGLRPNAPELIAVFQSCDVFVMPTEAEAFGIAAVEAAAAGLPAIVTSIGGLTDVVSDGETGFVIRPGDIHTLVARLRLLWDDPGLRRRLARGARERAAQRFDARKNGATIMAILRAAAARDA